MPKVFHGTQDEMKFNLGLHKHIDYDHVDKRFNCDICDKIIE